MSSTLPDRIHARLHDSLEAMNAVIATALHTSNSLMNEVIANYLLAKGKQIRPIIVFLSAGMLGNVNRNVVYAAAALEMLHNASLIHDDVVDETKQRRNRPTINALWDNQIAVLTGDFFVSKALEVGLRTGSVGVVAGLSALGAELSIGEVDQIVNSQSSTFSEEAYMAMIGKKTASLFRHCMNMGAETAGASPEDTAPMLRYAELLGLCFQIRDDIFDYYPQGEIGKPTGNDLREGKVTLPLLYALNHTSGPETEAMRELARKRQLDESDIQRLITFAIKKGGVEYAVGIMRRMQAEASAIIAGYPPSESAEDFEAIFRFIIDRNN